MVDDLAQSANELVEQRLRIILDDLEKNLSADVMAFSGGIVYGADTEIRDFVEWRKKQKPSKTKLAFFLETPGGYIEVAQRIASTFRKHYRRVEFFVPDAAMSAGTVLVMSGDAIHMDYYSTLGPIDPQLPKSDGVGYVPALGYLKKFDELMKKAAAGGLNTAETTYLCAKFDPAELYQYEHARKMSVFLLEQWLAKYKFRNWHKTRTHQRKVTPSDRRARAREIAEKLNDTEKWHSHGHGISLAVLRRDLKLEIEDFGRSKNRELIRSYWSILTDYMNKMGHRAILHAKGKYRQLA